MQSIIPEFTICQLYILYFIITMAISRVYLWKLGNMFKYEDDLSDVIKLCKWIKDIFKYGVY